MDHVVDILLSYAHPVVLVGCSAQRWMGSAGAMSRVCDLLIRDRDLESIGVALIQSGNWTRKTKDSNLPEKSNDFERDGQHPLKRKSSLSTEQSLNNEADLELHRMGTGDGDEYEWLCLWSETTYHLSLDGCPLVEVPDFYPWHHILVEEKWHPAIGREDGYWYGPRIHPDTKVLGLPKKAVATAIFSEGLPRGKSHSNHTPILVPSLPIYLDTLIYHKTHYHELKPDLAALASCVIRNLTRYLYLELPHQQLPLLMELEEDEFMEAFLKNYKRKPVWVRREVSETGAEGTRLEATQVKEWDPSTFPDWCEVTALSQRYV